jgi:hypothetical protein
MSQSRSAGFLIILPIAIAFVIAASTLTGYTAKPNAVSTTRNGLVPAQCLYAISPPHLEVDYDATTLPPEVLLMVSTDPACLWSTYPYNGFQSWVWTEAYQTLSGKCSGNTCTGNGFIAVHIQPNVNTSDTPNQSTPARQDFIYAVGPGGILTDATRVQVTQGGGCNNYALSPAVQQVPASGGTFKVNVTVDAGCYWDISRPPQWIEPDFLGVENGNGSWTYSVGPNCGNSARTATFNLAGKPFTVNQDFAVPASIATQPLSQQIINSGQTATLSVATAGSNLQYQWYQGQSGDTSSPVVGATASSFTTPQLFSSTRYWVRVSNSCANADSLTSLVAIAGPVEFKSSAFNVNEGDGTVLITVVRPGDVASTASVLYATSNGTAKEGTDYIAAFGVMNFAAGEATKTFPLLIIDNAFVDGSRTVNLILSNASGASLATPSSAVLTIADNDSFLGSNPLDTPRPFVQFHYYDFLARFPDASGWDFWTNQILSCGGNAQCIEVTRINVSAAFYVSIEFQNTGYLVERLYKVAYGDADGTSTLNGSHSLKVPIVRLNEFLPDTQEIGAGVVVGQTGWEQALENNKRAFALEYVQRARFTSAFAITMSPADFVDKLFSHAGVTPSPNERAAAINEFGTATDTSNVTARAQALRDVAENSTFASNEFNRGFVLMQYFGYLRRNPNDPPDTDYTGYDFWLTKLNQFNGNYINAEMVKAFIASTEYRHRFGP